nr:gypsy retrotransposon integrase-like protein 1 [Tanacetum cinerariifolium]
MGINISGAFPEAQGHVKFLIVAIDYFKKWVKAKPVATITGNQVKKFVWDYIVCRFGLPREITSDNEKQFKDNPFKGMPSLRCAKVNQAENKEELLLNLDILEERREKATVREAKSKAKMKKYYNARFRNTTFRPGDFIYRTNAKNSRKLGPKWEGPYEVVEALGRGAYKLRNGSGDILSHT